MDRKTKRSWGYTPKVMKAFPLTFITIFSVKALLFHPSRAFLPEEALSIAAYS